MGIMGRLMPPDQLRVVGLSTVADPDGIIAAHMDDHTDGVIVGQVAVGEFDADPMPIDVVQRAVREGCSSALRR